MRGTLTGIAVRTAARRTTAPSARLLASLVALTVTALGCSPAGPDRATGENAIVVENRKPGNPRSEWDVPSVDRPGIVGFATEMSVRPGETVRLKVQSWSHPFRIDVYRVGYYGGDGARKVASLAPTRFDEQPPCRFAPDVGRLDCANWSESAAWDVPDDAVSGLYLAKIVREGEGRERSNHVPFVVREREPSSELLFQTSDTTWQAYNRWGDAPSRQYSLYRGPGGNPLTKAVEVSYDRPFRIGAAKTPRTQHFTDGRHGPLAAEYPAIRFLERNGYDVGYQSGADTARRGDDLLRHRVFLSVGHDEYWSAGQRANVERARDAGVHLAFLGGNSIFYKIHWQDDYRTIVGYKRAPEPDDALQDVWTGRWSDERAIAVEAGVLPENLLKGTTGAMNSDRALAVPAKLSRHRFWRETDFANLPDGEQAVSIDNLVGYEWETDVDNGYRPAGLMRLSETFESEEFAVGVHHMTLHRDPKSRALVFSAGTIQLSWGLDGPDPDHRFALTGARDVPADRNIQQAIVNLFADMGVRASTLQPDLVQTEPSDDASAPVASFAEPAWAARAGEEVELAGTAADAGGGVVGGVEIETEGVWHRANGLEQWSYRSVFGTPGRIEVRVRAVDDSGNLGEVATAAVEVAPR